MACKQYLASGRRKVALNPALVRRKSNGKICIFNMPLGKCIRAEQHSL